ncbi:MAG: ABC transporter permease [Muribaculaceae bacterium]|nr:ABC transporter permease [Muribaculaceae bacterium]
MTLAWSIAWRYLFSKKSHSAVNIISIVSVAGVAIATAAIVIVLSVFNGFTALTEQQLTDIDPDAKALPAGGKTIANGDSLARTLAALPGVAAAVPVVEERGLMVCGGQQMPVVFKGIPDDYGEAVRLDSTIIDGAAVNEWQGQPAMTLSAGVAVSTGARPGSMVDLYVPRRVGRINPANPSASFRGERLLATAVSRVNHPDYDNDRVYIPLASARQMLDYDTEATAIEIAFEPGADRQDVIRAVAAAAGDGVKVMSRMQLQEYAFRMIAIEKWVTFMMLAFILVIASFNIISTLSLLVIEKRSNMQTLSALGASRSLATRIFICEGVLISTFGGILGIILGSALALAQQWGHFIRLAGDPTQLTTPYYPCQLRPLDLLAVLALVAVVALASSQSTRLFSKK